MMRLRNLILSIILVITIAGCGGNGGNNKPQDSPIIQPPYSGTIFLDQDILTSADPTALLSITYEGEGRRLMFDRRVDSFITVNAFLFNAEYVEGRTVEVQVNSEFGSVNSAKLEADFYSEAVGRLPAVLRNDLETLWIHKGLEPFGGGNNNILIHTGQAALYLKDGILEETLVHEAAHTSLDATHALAPAWLSAQNEDNTYISTYARDHSTREDIAETFLVYLAVRYKSDRISTSLKQTILETIPNRINYFDGHSFNMYPIQ